MLFDKQKHENQTNFSTHVFISVSVWVCVWECVCVSEGKMLTDNQCCVIGWWPGSCRHCRLVVVTTWLTKDARSLENWFVAEEPFICRECVWLCVLWKPGHSSKVRMFAVKDVWGLRARCKRLCGHAFRHRAGTGRLSALLPWRTGRWEHGAGSWKDHSPACLHR